jgi:hypothetical protein
MDAGQLMLRKKEIVTTTATRGWLFIVERADAVIKQMSNDAIDEEDEVKSKRLVYEARAARKFWQSLTSSVEASKQVEVEGAGDSDSWHDVATD